MVFWLEEDENHNDIPAFVIGKFGGGKILHWKAFDCN